MVQEWSCVRRILSACENFKKTRQGLCDLFLQNMELFLECVFMLFPGVAGRSWDNFKLLIIAFYCYSIKCLNILCMPLWKNMLLPSVVSPCGCMQLELMRTLLRWDLVHLIYQLPLPGPTPSRAVTVTTSKHFITLQTLKIWFKPSEPKRCRVGACWLFFFGLIINSRCQYWNCWD